MPNSDDTNPSGRVTQDSSPQKPPWWMRVVIHGSIIATMIVAAVIAWFFDKPLDILQPHISRLIIFICCIFIAGTCDFAKNRGRPDFVCYLILHFFQWLSLAAAAIILAEYIQIIQRLPMAAAAIILAEYIQI